MNVNQMFINHVLTPKDKPDAVVIITDKGQIYTKKVDYLELGKTGIVVTTCSTDLIFVDFPNENVTVYMRHARDNDTMTMFVFEDNVWSTAKIMPVKQRGLSGNVTSIFIHQLFSTVTEN